MKHESLLKVAPFSGSRVHQFDGTKRYLSTGDLQDDSISFIDVNYKDKPSRADIIVEQGDVLFARMKGTKKVLEIDGKLIDIIVSTGFAVLHPSSQCNGKYLSIYLKSDGFERQKEKYCSGAIQPAITNAGIKKIKIPLPPPDDQIRIANLLIKVDALITQRKQSLQELNDLIKSVFLEMFGDPVRNDKGWNSSPIEALCSNIVDCPHSTPIYSDVKTNYFCVRSSDIVNGYLDLDKTYQVDESVYLERIKRYTPQVGDIIYSREGGRLGNAARIIGKEKISLGQRIMLFKVNNENTNEFLWALLESASFKFTLQGLVGGGAAPRVNIKDLKKISVIKPPIDLQVKFSSIVIKIDYIKSQYQQSLTEMKNLYGTLSQKAFKGELDLSRVPLPEESVPKVNKVTLSDQVSVTDEVSKFVEYPMSVPEERERLLRSLFDEYLKQYKGENLSLDNFWQEANFKTVDLMDEFNKPWGVEDYDQIKKWLFSLIQDGKLEQTFSEEKKQIELKVKV